MFALAIFFPLTARVEAADIPDIRQLNPNIKPDVSIFETNYSVYVYTCNNGGYYAAQFVQILTKNYPFKIVFSDTQDEYPEWVLVYTGSKKVANVHNDTGETNHVHIMASNNDIDIRIGKGLTYAGHFITDDMGNVVGGY